MEEVLRKILEHLESMDKRLESLERGQVATGIDTHRVNSDVNTVDTESDMNDKDAICPFMSSRSELATCNDRCVLYDSKLKKCPLTIIAAGLKLRFTQITHPKRDLT